LLLFYFLRSFYLSRYLHSFPTRRSSDLTRLIGSFSIRASKMASEMASHILSGWPSVTDSDVNNLFSIIFPFHLSFTHSGIRMFLDRKSTRLNSSHVSISYAVFCLKKKNI